MVDELPVDVPAALARWMEGHRRHLRYRPDVNPDEFLRRREDQCGRTVATPAQGRADGQRTVL
jgi:hypothetical protein